MMALRMQAGMLFHSFGWIIFLSSSSSCSISCFLSNWESLLYIYWLYRKSLPSGVLLYFERPTPRNVPKRPIFAFEFKLTFCGENSSLAKSRSSPSVLILKSAFLVWSFSPNWSRALFEGYFAMTNWSACLLPLLFFSFFPSLDTSDLFSDPSTSPCDFSVSFISSDSSPKD